MKSILKMSYSGKYNETNRLFIKKREEIKELLDTLFGVILSSSGKLSLDSDNSEGLKRTIFLEIILDAVNFVKRNCANTTDCANNNSLRKHFLKTVSTLEITIKFIYGKNFIIERAKSELIKVHKRA